MLTKTTARATTDTKGCEFHYQVHIQKEFNLSQCKNVESRLYSCVEFPNVSAPTLKELKKKMGEL